MQKKDDLNVQAQLRASHFNLGNDQNNPYKTTNQMAFQKQPISQMASVGEKLALRESHFTLGNYEKPGFYNTTHNQYYTHHKDAQSARLEEEKKRDLRTHHFQMGQYGPTTKTQNNLVYSAKPVQENLQQDRDQQKAKMRAHNHNFAESSNLVMTTHYNDQFNKEIDPAALKQGIPTSQLKQKVVDLRNSHIILGKERVPMLTTQKIDYDQKPDAKVEGKNPLLQQSHFHLGDSKTDFVTTNNDFHRRQPLTENKLAEETMKDLRSSHFVVGADQQSYMTEQKDHYVDKQGGAMKKVNLDQRFFTNNFNHTNPNGTTNYNSAYKMQMKAPVIEHSQQSRNQHQDRGSSFKLGIQGDSWQTEFNSKFGKQDGGPQQMDKVLMGNLRSSHFEFNDVKSNSFKSTSKAAFGAKDGSNARGTLDEALQKDLRTHHFNLGKQEQNYQTSYNRFYTAPVNAERATFNSQRAADLRADHFKIS